jgi:protocatechuate 3,4-dioxygenase beta subunit
MGNLPGKFFRLRKFGVLAAVALTIMTIGFEFEGTTHSTPFRPPARLIELSGTIRDTQGRPVAALKVSLMNWFGEGFGSAVTDDQGSFAIRNVAPGSYYVKFRPLAENSPGQVVIFYVPPHATHINMTVNRNPSALARAQSSSSALG